MSNKFLTTITILFLSATLVVASGCSDGDKTDSKSKQSIEAKHDHGEHATSKKSTMSSTTMDDHSGHDHAKMNGMSSQVSIGGTMKAVMTSSELFECPMCAGVVAADINTPCPICKMVLVPMSDDKAAELRASHPKGCPMDAIVVAGDSKTENCPVCKMKLEKIS